VTSSMNIEIPTLQPLGKKCRTAGEKTLPPER